MYGGAVFHSREHGNTASEHDCRMKYTFTRIHTNLYGFVQIYDEFHDTNLT